MIELVVNPSRPAFQPGTDCELGKIGVHHKNVQSFRPRSGLAGGFREGPIRVHLAPVGHCAVGAGTPMSDGDDDTDFARQVGLRAESESSEIRATTLDTQDGGVLLVDPDGP